MKIVHKTFFLAAVLGLSLAFAPASLLQACFTRWTAHTRAIATYLRGMPTCMVLPIITETSTGAIQPQAAIFTETATAMTVRVSTATGTTMARATTVTGTDITMSVATTVTGIGIAITTGVTTGATGKNAFAAIPTGNSAYPRSSRKPCRNEDGRVKLT